ncbi:hypothetical protein LCGC14_2497160, partial [marine sediment metagenome]
FFRQNISNPNRVQNYVSQRFPGYNPEFSSVEDRNYLMRKLKQNQNPNSNYITQFKSLNRNYYSEEPIHNNRRFQDYNKNHLTELFNSDDGSPPRTYRDKRHSIKLDNEIQETMLELNKERYSVKQTIKKLDTKFDQGIISEVDYFKTYKNLQKDFYFIDTKIQSLKERLEEAEIFKQKSRNFDEKNFY